MRARVRLFFLKAMIRERERECDTSHDACRRKGNRMANGPDEILREVRMVDLYRSILQTPSTSLLFFRQKNDKRQLSLRPG